MKIIELLKVSELEIFPNGIQIFFKLPFHFKWKSHVIFSLGFWVEKNLNSRRSESKYESLGKSFFPSHLTFKSFEFTHFQSINQTINQIYLFIITFQNLEFWDVTNLPPLNESRP